MIVLPEAADTNIIRRMLQEAIESELGVEETRENGNPPTVVVRPR